MLFVVAAVLLTALALALWIGSRRQQRAVTVPVERLTRAAASAPCAFGTRTSMAADPDT